MLWGYGGEWCYPYPYMWEYRNLSPTPLLLVRILPKYTFDHAEKNWKLKNVEKRKTRL